LEKRGFENGCVIEGAEMEATVRYRLPLASSSPWAEGLLPPRASRVSRIAGMSTGMGEGEAGGLAKQNRPDGPGG